MTPLQEHLVKEAIRFPIGLRVTQCQVDGMPFVIGGLHSCVVRVLLGCFLESGFGLV